MVETGAQTLPVLAGVSAPAGSMSSVTARVNAARMYITVIGARRRTASVAQQAACTPSRVQASEPG